MMEGCASVPPMRRVASLQVHLGTARIRVLLVCMSLLLVSPVLAFESHVVNVRMSLTAPADVDRDEFELAADGTESTAFSVTLTPAFLEQSRLDVVDYRVITSVEPADELAARAPTPTVVCVRDPAEGDETPDDVGRARLGTDPTDPSDRWIVTLQPASDGAMTGLPEAGEPSSETPPTGSSFAASGSIVATAAVAEAARWSVRVWVEVVGYGATGEAGE